MTVLRAGQGHIGFNYMQKIHPNLLLGFDYTNLVKYRLNADIAKTILFELRGQSIPRES